MPQLALDLAGQVLDYPRHLGIHSGGMVMADRPLVEFCPIEWARMEDRSVLQWDKDDCAAAGLVKFDLLGLGMLTMLHLAVDLIREHGGVDVDLATIPQDDDVYDLLCAADTIGVFQVESRAADGDAAATAPRCFYDLVIEVALIRPGPIQGGSVHPYLRRRNGEEPVTYPHPILESCLEKTLGVPLFQEQLMQIAIDAAGFSPGEADQLRQAMGSKRSKARMAAMRDRLMEGMAERGITGETAEEIAGKLEAFADFGFPESHSVSFAYLVYSSSWVKLPLPGRVRVRAAQRAADGLLLAAHASCATRCVTASRCSARASTRRAATARSSRARPQPDRSGTRSPGGTPTRRPTRCASASATCAVSPAICSIASTRHARISLLARSRSPTSRTSPGARTRRSTRSSRSPPRVRSRAWASTGATRCGPPVRCATHEPGTLPGLVTGVEAPALPGMDPIEETAADLWATGMSAGRHPTEFVREQLRARGAVTSATCASSRTARSWRSVGS